MGRNGPRYRSKIDYFTAVGIGGLTLFVVATIAGQTRRFTAAAGLGSAVEDIVAIVVFAAVTVVVAGWTWTRYLSRPVRPDEPEDEARERRYEGA